MEPITQAHHIAVDDYHIMDVRTGEVKDSKTLQVEVAATVQTPESYEEVRKAIESKKRRKLEEHYRRRTQDQLGNFIFMQSDYGYGDIAPQILAKLVYSATFLPYCKQSANKKQGLAVLQTYKGKKLTKRDLKEELNLAGSSFARFWDAAEGKYIFEDTDGYVYMSERFLRGKLPKEGKHETYQKLYIKTVRDLYKKCPKEGHKDLGRIFQLLPYLNFEWNILCWYPEETELNAIRPMTVTEFCEIVGVSPENQARFCKRYGKITFPVDGHEERFCSFVPDGENTGATRIAVNPRVLYSGSDWRKVEVLCAFTIPS